MRWWSRHQRGARTRWCSPSRAKSTHTAEVGQTLLLHVAGENPSPSLFGGNGGGVARPCSNALDRLAGEYGRLGTGDSKSYYTPIVIEEFNKPGTSA